MSNMKATHAQDELACFLVFFFRLPGQWSHTMMVNYWPCFVETSRYRTELTAQRHQGSLVTGEERTIADHR